MSLNRVSTFTFCIMLVGALSCATARAETVDRIVANVNGEIILYSELQQQIKVMEKNMQLPEATDPVNKAKVEREVLTQLIRQKLADMEAERLKVTASNAEVEGRIQQILAQGHGTMAQLEANLKANGQTLDSFRVQVKKDMERQRLVDQVCKSKVLIGDQQVDAFLKGENAGSVLTTPKVHLGLIILPFGDKYATKPEDAAKTGREILEKLKGGADFQSMAKQYSKGSSAQEGGDVGYLGADELAPFIAQGIHNLGKNQVSGLIQGPGGYYIVKLYDFGGEPVAKSDPDFREKVRRSLYEKECNRKFEEWVRDLESRAFIQISL